MTRLTLVATLVIFTLASLAAAHAEQHRMIKLISRQQQPSTPPSLYDFNSRLSRADPHLGIAQDSDAEAMRQMMRHKAESVIASFAGDSLPNHIVDSILAGEHPSVHPGSLGNISWSMDMFEHGSTLPVGSSSSSSSTYSYHYESSWSSSSSGSTDDSEPTKSDSKDSDGILTVDDLLHTFFHADPVSTLFTQVQSETRKPLNKQSKKDIIKKTAPMLHRTIEKVASHRGWGVQDARFARMHLEEDVQEGEGGEAFKDYNTFVKTMRSALISPNDAGQQT